MLLLTYKAWTNTYSPQQHPGFYRVFSLGKSPREAESFEMLCFQLEEQNSQGSVCEVALGEILTSLGSLL